MYLCFIFNPLIVLESRWIKKIFTNIQWCCVCVVDFHFHKWSYPSCADLDPLAVLLTKIRVDSDVFGMLFCPCRAASVECGTTQSENSQSLLSWPATSTALHPWTEVCAFTANIYLNIYFFSFTWIHWPSPLDVITNTRYSFSNKIADFVVAVAFYSLGHKGFRSWKPLFLKSKLSTTNLELRWIISQNVCTRYSKLLKFQSSRPIFSPNVNNYQT